MAKAPDAFRTISEVAEWLDVAPHVLRFWESKFSQVKPVKRAGGRRYYRPSDMELLGGIKVLLHDEGNTIKAVQSMIRENGVSTIAARSPMLDGAEDVIDVTPEDADADNVVAFEPAEAEQVEAPVEEAEAAPEPAATPEPAPEPAPEPEAVEEQAASEPPAPKPRIIEVAEIPSDEPDYAALSVSALGLSLHPDQSRISAKADEIAPLFARLKALRAQMTSHGAR